MVRSSSAARFFSMASALDLHPSSTAPRASSTPLRSLSASAAAFSTDARRDEKSAACTWSEDRSWSLDTMAGRWDDTPSSSASWPWREEMTLASSAERVERADDSFDFALAAASRSALREGEREREREREKGDDGQNSEE